MKKTIRAVVRCRDTKSPAEKSRNLHLTVSESSAARAALEALARMPAGNKDELRDGFAKPLIAAFQRGQLHGSLDLSIDVDTEEDGSGIDVELDLPE